MNLVPFYRRSGVRTALGVAVWIGLYVWAANAVQTLTSDILTGLIDLGLSLLALGFAIGLVAQFVLPARSLEDRAAVVQRLLDYLLGNRGPVLFVRNGRALESHGERSRQGAGVVLIDHASAAVLRTPTRFTRAVGPGVVFTEPGETLAEPLDLRPQIRYLRGEPPSIQAQEGQGFEALALTEDGIPVSADLTITFLLDPGHASTPRQGQFPNLPPYEFNTMAAERAVYGRAYKEGKGAAWSDLPLLVLEDLWREQVKQWSLPSLLQTGGARPTPLERIRQAIVDRLLPASEPLPDSQARQDRREHVLLQDRGIRVLDVEIRRLHVPDEVRRERLRRWREEWSGEVEDELVEARAEAHSARRAGRRQGRLTLSDELSRSLGAHLADGETPGIKESLEALVGDALRLCQEPELLADAAGVSAQLRAIQEDLASMDSRCRQIESRRSP